MLLTMTESFFEFRQRVVAREPRTQPAPTSSAPPLTVSELTMLIDRVLRAELPQVLMVRGECSNCHAHKESGHFYLTLKDAGACIDCVMFRDDFRLLKFDPVDGVELLATGRVAVYAQRGRYQLYVRRLEPLGQGALELKFQKLRAVLEREGLFAPKRKKPLPRYPVNIALVTGQETAALQDMLKVLNRFPWLKPKIHHVPVQGAGAAARIADAIVQINRSATAELILLARGGGSLEDLWEFNEETLARAIAASKIPIITGIGHEVDVSIADLVADHHAHTPTEAAQVATAQWRSARDELDLASARLRRAVKNLLSDARHRLSACERHEVFRRPTDRINSLKQLIDDRERSLRIAAHRGLASYHTQLRRLEQRLEKHRPTAQLARMRERIATLSEQLFHTAARRLRRAHTQLAKLDTRLALRHPRNLLRLSTERVNAAGRELDALNPLAVLRRGYSVTMLKKGGIVVRSAAQIQGGETLITRLSDGQIESIAEDAQQPRLFES